MRISEPRYSIKNVEAFYLDPARAGLVTTAGDSIVIYERFRRLGDKTLLDEIEAYNKIDCQSLRRCRDGSLTLRPVCPGPSRLLPKRPIPDASRSGSKPNNAGGAYTSANGRISTRRSLVANLLAYLLEFHRREAKPKYWAMFTRQEMTDEELIDDFRMYRRS